jgi:hypothetical protein
MLREGKRDKMKEKLSLSSLHIEQASTAFNKRDIDGA